MKEKRARILVVDDDENILKLVEAMLIPQGYETVRASDGEKAIEAVRNQKPDLILMDIMMPKVDGYTACHAIKTNQATKAIPVVMLSGLGYELNKKLSQQLGADGYITKPFSLHDLLDTINKYLPAP